jgi:Alw26I/Eco31I/Esp3I family type II restriction m6 adenine DNA methyltransferase
VKHALSSYEEVPVKQALDSQAWSIVDGLHQLVAKERSLNTLEKTEVVRLAGLTYAARASPIFTDYEFSKVSFEAERSGITYSEIMDSARSCLESFGGPSRKRVSTSGLVTLLGLIHSLGSHHLPMQYDKGTSQRPLGAYYTPQHIADYIVGLTMDHTLDALVKSVPKLGTAALEQLLRLRTLDPACGTGVFLISAYNRMFRSIDEGLRLARASGVTQSELELSGIIDFRDKIRHNIYGVDIDSSSLEVAEVSIDIVSGSRNVSENVSNLKRGNSLVSIKGLNGIQDHNHFFSNPSLRQPFEWIEEYREVMETGGFDFVVMNPPYERMKPNLAEFLRERILLGNREIHLKEFENYKSLLNEDLNYYRNSGEYKHGNRYTIDAYRLFIERAIQLARSGGMIGFIVPSTILGDLSANPIRRSILLENDLQIVNEFPESSKIFDGVTQSVSVLTLRKGGTTTSFQARFGMKGIEDLSSRKLVEFDTSNIRLVTGMPYSIPQVNKNGWALLDKIHRHSSLHSLDWMGVNRGELDLTLNRSCIVKDTTGHRLIRGSNISRYSLISTSNRPDEYVEFERLRNSMKTSSRIRHVGVPRIACQQVSNRTQRWRLKFARIPPDAVLANSCNYVYFNDGNEGLVPFLLGILNSEVINWRFELSNTNNHVSIREMKQLPIPNPEEIPKDLFRGLISEVNSIEPDDEGTYTALEALIFSIYGFSDGEAKDILKMRQTPTNEIQEIVENLLS